MLQESHRGTWPPPTRLLLLRQKHLVSLQVPPSSRLKATPAEPQFPWAAATEPELGLCTQPRPQALGLSFLHGVGRKSSPQDSCSEKGYTVRPHARSRGPGRPPFPDRLPPPPHPRAFPSASFPARYPSMQQPRLGVRTDTVTRLQTPRSTGASVAVCSSTFSSRLRHSPEPRRAELGAGTAGSRPAKPLNSCEPWGGSGAGREGDLDLEAGGRVGQGDRRRPGPEPARPSQALGVGAQTPGSRTRTWHEGRRHVWNQCFALCSSLTRQVA